MQDVPEHDAVRLVLTRAPGDPAHEAVDGVRVLRLGQWKLMPASVELVAAVLQTVRPRDEHLAATPRRHLVEAVAVDDVLAVGGIPPKPAAHLDRDHTLLGERDLELLAGRAEHRAT